MEFYTDAINGAIQLFLEDLPNAITRAAAVQKSFTEEGILDIKRLEEEITKAASQFDATAAAIGGAFSKRIVEGLDREETKQAFLDLIKDALANATIASFVAEQIPKLLEGIDFTQPLSLSSEAMAALAEQVGIASDNLYALLEAAGLLPDVIEETNDKVEDVVDSTKDLEEQAQNIVSQIRQIENDLTSLAQKRVTIRLDLVERLASIGSISTLQAINTKAQALLAQIDTIQALTAEGTGVTELTTEKLDQLFAAHSQLADLIVARFNAEADAIRQNGQLAIDQIHAEYEAKRQAISDTIDGLNDSRQLTQEYYAEQIEGLQENLRIAQEFQQVSKQIGQSIAQLVTGPQSALSRSEQSAFLDARIASLRQQPLTAEVASELSQLLQQRLGASLSQQGSVAFFEEFSGVIQQLQDLETTTGAQGETALTIQTQIKNIEEQSRIALASIDAQIEQQQDLLADLSRQEQQAVLRAQQQTELKIAELRTVAERQLRENAAQQDRIAAEAQTKREQQRQLLVGIDKATQLLSDPNNALIVTLVEMGAVLDRLNNTLASITPAATGFEGLLTKPRLFLAGERGPEYVSISPSGTRSGGMATTINAPLTVNLSGRATEEDGQRLARGYIEALKYEIRHSDLGVAIQQRVLGR
jgi:hypothetical protein